MAPKKRKDDVKKRSGHTKTRKAHNMDERVWMCTAEGPLTAMIVEIPTSVPPGILEKWNRYNAEARAIAATVNRREPVSLRELGRVFGEFTARHQKTGDVISGAYLRQRLRYMPGK